MSDRAFTVRLLTIAAAIAIFYLLVIPRTTLWDRDEPRFAQAAVEMARSGAWLYPTNDGTVRAQKPILTYWLMALSVRLLGPTETAFRCWSVISLAVVAFATGWIGRRVVSARAGLMAAPIAAFTPLAAVEGTAATADALLLACTTVAMTAWTARLTGARAGVLAVFTVALAAALLTKGAAGLAAPGIAAVAWLFMLRQPGSVRRGAELALCTAIALAAFGWWFVAADAATGGAFTRDHIGREVLGRILTPLDGHGGSRIASPPYYAVVFFAGFAPWSAVLMSRWRIAPLNVASSTRALVLAWAIVPFVAYMLVATRLPHYVWPAWPALALIVAAQLDGGARERAGPWHERVEVALGGAIVAVSVAALLAAPWLLHAPLLTAPSIAGALALVVAFAARMAGGARAAFATGLAGLVALESVLAFWWLPRVEMLKPVPCIVRAVAATPGEVGVSGFGEPSLAFYLGAAPTRVESDAAAHAWLTGGTARRLITTQERAARLPGVIVATCSGFDVVHGTALTLALVRP